MYMYKRRGEGSLQHNHHPTTLLSILKHPHQLLRTMHLAKMIAAAVGLAVGVSAAGWESLCIANNTVSFLSNNKFQDRECLLMPVETVMNKWGGGFANCDQGFYQVFWNINWQGEAHLCYGALTTCAHYKGNEDTAKAAKGYNKCWSVQIP
ncbi:hypothetical protein BGX31_010068 [Mortierella sp. GBA43]|nr:hypothetical protein BGX31_010068 [Mortierella sp. GBA43]